MAYTINLTDGTLFAVIPDSTINTESSMTLIGKNYAGYGAYLDTNFIHLLENSSNPTPPNNPLVGQLWWNSTGNVLQIYNGTGFKNITSAYASPIAPTNVVAGDLWFNTTANILNVYTGSAFLAIGSSISNGSGTLSTVILDNVSTPHSVVELLVENNIVGIISKDSPFIPLSPIPGFTSVGSGITLASAINGIPQFFNGNATVALTLDGLSPNLFMRTDIGTSTVGPLGVTQNGISANGLIESTSGGFKFPDGSIQTSAATGNGGGGGVSSFNTRTGAVVLESSDIQSALGYIPPSPTGNSLLAGNGAGGFTNVIIGSGLVYSGNTLIATGGNGNVTTGVLTFNGRSGVVTLQSSDVTTALGYTPISNAGGNISGPITVAGLIHTTTGGIEFPDGSIQTSAATGNGSSGVSSFNTRTGAVTLQATDVDNALGYTPFSSAGGNISGAVNVAGVINSTSGGYKFPDGTTQTTAATGGAASSVPPGAVSYFAMSTPPGGWLTADGSAVSRTSYGNLFAAIGTVFGSGDGSTTFNLPDLRGQFIRGWTDGGTVDPGRAFGSVQASSFAAHSHGITDPGHTHTISDPGHTHNISSLAHTHGISDPGHSHTISNLAHTHGINDPGHSHSVGNLAHSHGINDPGHNHGIGDPGHAHGDYGHGHADAGHDHGGVYTPGGGSNLYPTGNSATERNGVTGIGYAAIETGYANLAPALTGIGPTAGSGTGISIQDALGGVGTDGATTNISTESALGGTNTDSAITQITNIAAVTNISTNNAGGTDTYPINVALLACIKY